MAALAPATDYPVSGHGPEWVMAFFVAALGVGAVMGWAWALQVWPWGRAVGPIAWWGLVVACGIGTAWAMRGAWLKPLGRLSWDPHALSASQRWRWVTPAWPTGLAARHVVCVVDVQHLMLLQLQAPAGLAVWCWVRRQSSPQDWLALRRAVFHQPLHEADAASPMM